MKTFLWIIKQFLPNDVNCCNVKSENKTYFLSQMWWPGIAHGRTPTDIMDVAAVTIVSGIIGPVRSSHYRHLWSDPGPIYTLCTRREGDHTSLNFWHKWCSPRLPRHLTHCKYFWSNCKNISQTRIRLNYVKPKNKLRY